MSRGVRKVRKSIMQRKKRRGLPPSMTGITSKQVISPFVQEEEKHGFVQTFPDMVEQSSSEKSSFISSLIVKATLSAMLFVSTALLWNTDTTLFANVKSWTSDALTEEFPFAKVNVWYQETFGNPLAFTPTGSKGSEHDGLALPVSGSVTESFQTNGKGIMIAPDTSSVVSAIQEGIVIFAGNDRETKKTVKVQHPDGSTSTYGHLNTVNVHLYQMIGTGEELGQFIPTSEKQTFYFSIKKNKEYVDPIQVIQVDDQS